MESARRTAPSSIRVVGPLTRWRLPAHLDVDAAGRLELPFSTEELSRSQTLIIDAGAVEELSGPALRSLDSLLSLLRSDGVAPYFIAVRERLLAQLLALSDGPGWSVVSVLAPYHCDDCREEKLSEIDLRVDATRLRLGKPPPRRCGACGKRMAFNAAPGGVFGDLVTPEVSALVEQYLLILRNVELSEGRYLKIVEGDLTWFWLGGPVGADLNVRRLTAGVEGRVVFDFARAHIDPIALSRILDIVDTAGETAKVHLWRAPPQLLRAVGARLTAKTTVLTVASAWQCPRCSAEDIAPAPTAQYRRAAITKEPLTRTCDVCDGPVTTTAFADISPYLLGDEVPPPEFFDVDGRVVAALLGRVKDEPDPNVTLQLKLSELRGRIDQLLTSRGGDQPTLMRRLVALADDAQSALADRAVSQRMLQAVSEVGKLAQVMSRVEDLLAGATELLMRTLRGQAAGIFFPHDTGLPTLMAGFAHDPALLENLAPTAQRVIRAGRALQVAGEGVPKRATLWVPIPGVSNKTLGCIFVTGGGNDPTFSRRGLWVLEGFATHVASAIERAELELQRKEQQRQRESLSRYFSEAVVSEIISRRTQPEMGGVSRRVTVLFTDIRNSTGILEQLPPNDAVSLLNDYFAEIVDEVLAEKGTLDKFTGDGIMAFWGAPSDQPDHALRACRAALKIQQRLPLLQARWRAQGKTFAEHTANMTTGIGIHTGEVVVGNIGSPKRMEYTAIGDTVNVTARIQGLAQGGEVLISESTMETIEKTVDMVWAEERPAAQLKGRAAPMKLFRLMTVGAR